MADTLHPPALHNTCLFEFFFFLPHLSSLNPEQNVSAEGTLVSIYLVHSSPF